MSELGERINQLQTRLDKMVEYQDYFYREINQLQAEIKSLKETASMPTADVEAKPPTPPPAREPVFPKSVPPPRAAPPNYQPPRSNAPPNYQPPASHARINQPTVENKSGFEEFVGKNLISLVGIIITVLGVGIGAKYAIDRDLISPLTRIVLGYSFAAATLAVAVWLQKKYLNFSAVLLSGALAMMYFLTFFAYSFYELIPQTAAFAMMLVFTVFAVVAAVRFNRQVIAHVGLVGAYAVPFLLSEDSGRADILFGYMTIINFGILAISVVKFWKPLYYSSFIFTWLIYAAWYFSSYSSTDHFALAFGFALVFFLTFYLTFLSYKLLAKEEFNAEIVVLVLINSFIFYGFGYLILNRMGQFTAYLGLFTLANAALNFFVAFVVHKYRLGDRKNFYLTMALAVTFITIAVPVQFSGNWVTLIWTAEAALLFWIGRAKQIALYESLSYPLMFLASVSLLNIWQTAFTRAAVVAPVFNPDFLTAILFAAAFGFITFVNRDGRYESSVKGIRSIFSFILPTIFLFALYNAFRIEIGNYFHSSLAASAVEIVPAGEFNEAVTRRDDSLNRFNILWQINYSMFFLALLAFVNIKKIKSAALGLINLGLSSAILFAFLTAGLYLLGEMRSDYLTPPDNDVFPRGAFHILFRYVCFAFVAALVYASYEYIKREFLHKAIAESFLELAFDFAFHLSVLWIASSELINLTDIYGYRDSYKLGLSILWGSYSLLLIVLGIIKRKAHLRIGAIALFAVTLAKLFFYDIADLDTISKTVVFLILGILLLIISFLYNKYKDLIFGRNEGETENAET